MSKVTRINKGGRVRTQEYRDRARTAGGVIVYAVITDPQAVKAWGELKKIFGTNRDAVENAIIDCYEQMEKTP